MCIRDRRSFCRAVAVQIYNLNVLLDLEKVAIGGGISKQPILCLLYTSRCV